MSMPRNPSELLASLTEQKRMVQSWVSYLSRSGLHEISTTWTTPMHMTTDVNLSQSFYDFKPGYYTADLIEQWRQFREHIMCVEDNARSIEHSIDHGDDGSEVIWTEIETNEQNADTPPKLEVGPADPNGRDNSTTDHPNQKPKKKLPVTLVFLDDMYDKLKKRRKSRPSTVPPEKMKSPEACCKNRRTNNHQQNIHQKLGHRFC